MSVFPTPQPAASAVSSPAEVLPAQELLAWRRRLQLQCPGTASELDWLLDLGGGLGWQALQQLLLDPQRPVALQRSLAELEALWHQHRQEQTPLQYLLGICPWRDLQLQVAPGVLIPRAETELLVELAVQLPEHPPTLWADLGSGSGALAVALARAWPHSRGLAVELSDAARHQAEANLQAAGVAAQVQLQAGSWWQPLEPWWGQLQLVVANPPYIPTPVWQSLEPGVREHEPRLALDGGADGLTAIRSIAAGAAAALAPGGWFLLEHHFDQSDAVAALLAAAGLVQLDRH
ncbi:MAG: HemK/PrmC family methyltransferase, partial [Cyanobacteriota bacterium]|nr:HemK/PrmC family methyltransferase [Cyanobacteriota bacterium]